MTAGDTKPGIWIKLLKIQDGARHLVKSEINLLKMEHLPWAEDFANDIVTNLERLIDIDPPSNPNITNFDPQIYRWDEVYVTDVTTDPLYAQSNFPAGVAMADGTPSQLGTPPPPQLEIFHRLTINIHGFESYPSYQAMMDAEWGGQLNYWYGNDLDYLFNHEFGHRLTTPNGVGSMELDDFFSPPEISWLIGKTERPFNTANINEPYKVDEAFAEIYAIFRDEGLINMPQSIVDKFNQYSILKIE